mmetsp:Transcript_39596/g.51055  ORF Transcript_39596/g.51055 Transcript_39596/m.51055 type:complete len:441 (+) Transcript_39596:60-1382(+)
MSSLLPFAEVYDWARKTIPALMPIPPPPYEDDRYNDRIDEKDLQRVTRLSKALGMKYVELDRFLQVFSILDNLRLGEVSIRQISVQWNFKHTIFVDMIFAQCKSEYQNIRKEAKAFERKQEKLKRKNDKLKKQKKNKQRPNSASSTITSDDDELKSINSNQTDRHKENSNDTANETSAPLRTMNATQLFLNLFEFCTLTDSELLMFILHCLNIHQPSHVPTPQQFMNRLIRLVHGPKPSLEVTQLLRCLRCLFEPYHVMSSSSSSSSSRPSSSSSSRPSSRSKEDIRMNKNNENYNNDQFYPRSGGNSGGSGGHSSRESSPTHSNHSESDSRGKGGGGRLGGKYRRLLLHDDERASISERWASISWILLKFPIVIQPALALHKALQRKTLGKIFWERMGQHRRLFPLRSRRVGFPVMTAQRILASVELLQDDVDEKHETK